MLARSWSSAACSGHDEAILHKMLIKYQGSKDGQLDGHDGPATGSVTTGSDGLSGSLHAMRVAPGSQYTETQVTVPPF